MTHLYPAPYAVCRDKPSIEQVQQAVASFYGFTLDELRSTDRRGPLVHARQVAAYLARDLTGHSLSVLGKWFDRDHTTMLSSIRQIERKRDWALDRDLDAIRAGLAR